MSDTRRPSDAAINIILMRAGVPPHLRGYRFLLSAVRLRVDGKSHSIYQQVAELHGASVSLVERNIRTAVNHAWESGALRHFCETAGHSAERCPTNSEFIVLVAGAIAES